MKKRRIHRNPAGRHRSVVILITKPSNMGRIRVYAIVEGARGRNLLFKGNDRSDVDNWARSKGYNVMGTYQITPYEAKELELRHRVRSEGSPIYRPGESRRKRKKKSARYTMAF